MKGSKSATLLTMLGIVAAVSESGMYPHEEERLGPRIITEGHRIQQNRKRGLRCFTIDGKDVWALNYKNAVRKAKKLNDRTKKKFNI